MLLFDGPMVMNLKLNKGQVYIGLGQKEFKYPNPSAKTRSHSHTQLLPAN